MDKVPFNRGEFALAAAPMVRFSKLPFRQLVRRYKCNLVYSPMIIADSFIKSPRARDSEFTTCPDDNPLVIQFGAKSAEDFASAAQLVAPFAQAVDLNCGCPQKWAMQSGYGAHLLSDPDLIRDMVRQAMSRAPGLAVTIKIRIENDLKRTVQLAQTAEHLGVSWIAVHGRTARQRSSSPPDYAAIKLVKESVGVPVLANGSIYSLSDVKAVREATGVDGVMAARGLLENPAMYAGYESTPAECFADYFDLALGYGMPHRSFMHLLGKMCENVIGQADRKILYSQMSMAGVLEFFHDRYGIVPRDSRVPLFDEHL